MKNIHDQITYQTCNRSYDQIEKQVNFQIRNQIQVNEIRNQIQVNVLWEARRRTWQQVRQGVYCQTFNHIWFQITDQIDKVK
jgi:hypothetical protein